MKGKGFSKAGNSDPAPKAREMSGAKPKGRMPPNPVTEEADEKKAGGKVEGKMAKKHAGRKARKSGGRAGCENNPFTSAASGSAPSGHSVKMN
jgi:hypothetical protein